MSEQRSGGPLQVLPGDGGSGQLPAAPATAPDDTTLATRRMVLMMESVMGAMQQIANSMAGMSTNVQQLLRRLDMAERVTPAQAKELGKAIKRRVTELCGAYGILHADTQPKAARRIDAMIRRDLRVSVGLESRSLRDLPRVEYQVYLGRVAMWDEYEAIMEVVQGGR